MDLRGVHQRGHATAGRDDGAGLDHPVLDTPGHRGLEGVISDGVFQAFDAGFGFGLGGLGLAHGGSGDADPAGFTVTLGLAFLEFGLGDERVVTHPHGVVIVHLRDLGLEALHAHLALCTGHGLGRALAHCHHAVELTLQIGGVHLRDHVAHLDQVAFVHGDALHLARELGGDLDALHIQPAVAGNDLRRRLLRAQGAPGGPGARHRQGGHHSAQDETAVGMERELHGRHLAASFSS